jgi:hypothetical protein
VIGKTLKLSEFLIDKLKQGENTMDVSGFLLASGFALLVVLLGWANQITSKSKETKELEAQFLEKAKFKKGDYKKIINEKGSTEDSFSALIDFLYSSKKDKQEDVEIFEKIENIKKDLASLDNLYGWRFWILLFMSTSLFVTGVTAFFLSPNYKLWALAPNGIFIIIVFCNLVKVYNLEKRYTINISESMEKL